MTDFCQFCGRSPLSRFAPEMHRSTFALIACLLAVARLVAATPIAVDQGSALASHNGARADKVAHFYYYS